MFRIVCTTGVLLFSLSAGSAARGETATPTPSPRLQVVELRVGPTLLKNSRSKSLGHLLKPLVRLATRVEVTNGFEVGAALLSILDTSEHYRVAGMLATGRWAVFARPRFSAGLGFGFGAGYGADILDSDLYMRSSIVPYGYLSADARWRVGAMWAMGVEGAWENGSMYSLGLNLAALF
ncbi:MAG: hypothetical protein SGI86_18270 [Deltaproteobacteria bacterium]|nr:hypothetical protein [Deltaproteobacteria bacterium]